jgi:hypothetical protein
MSVATVECLRIELRVIPKCLTPPVPSKILHSYTPNPVHVSRHANQRPGADYFEVYFHFQRNGIARVPVLTTRNVATGTLIGSPEPLITFTFMLNIVTGKNELQFSTCNEKVRPVLLYIFIGDEMFLDDRLMCRSAGWTLSKYATKYTANEENYALVVSSLKDYSLAVIQLSMVRVLSSLPLIIRSLCDSHPTCAPP